MNFALSAGVALTMHLSMGGPYNEVHPYVKLQNERVGVSAFKNSEGNASVAAYLRGRSGPWWGELGAATGYENATLMPFIRGGRDFGRRSRAFIAPGMAQDGNIGLTLGWEQDF